MARADDLEHKDRLPAVCLGVFTKNMIMIYSLFKNLLDIFLFVFYKHFV